MHVGLQTWGSDGDVRPFLALGDRLRRRGHRVTVVVGSPDEKDYTAICQTLGLEYVRAPETFGVRQEGLLERVGSGRNVLRMMRVLLHEGYFPGLAAMEAAAARLVQQCDVVVGHFFAWPLRIAAMKAGRPYASVAFWPGAVPGPERPPPPFPDLGPWMNEQLWGGAQWILERAVGPTYEELWRRHGLQAPPLAGGALSDRLSFIAASPQLCPEPHGRHRVVGAFRLPADSDTALPRDLETFLSQPEKPVFLSLGSTAMSDEARAEALLVEAAERAGVRAVIHLGPGRTPPRPQSDRMFFVGRMPHAPIMARCVAAVHHGGAGTTHAALEAGLPAMVLPFINEQAGWGQALQRRGVGVEVIPYQQARYVPSRVAHRVRCLVDDIDMQQRARRVGALMAAEDGASVAAEHVEALGISAASSEIAGVG